LRGRLDLLAKPRVTHNLLNDLDPKLMNCYTHVRDRVEDLIEALDGVTATKENHARYKAWAPNDPLERAARWFFLNRTSYSGIMNMANCYWGYGEKYSMTPECWPAHLRRVSEKLQGVELARKDFREVIRSAERGCFLFIDPPYYGADQDKFYTHAFTPQDHKDLYKVLSERGDEIKFLLTYDNRLAVWRMYNHWCHVRPQEWGYTIQRTDDQRNDRRLADGHQGRRMKGKELLITNYELSSTCLP
jgi:DNA adenine methylase